MTLVAEVIDFVVSSSALCTEAMSVDLKAAVTENAPSWEQEWIHSRHNHTISTGQNCPCVSGAAARAGTINAGGLGTEDTFALEHGVAINTGVTGVLGFTNAIILAFLAMLDIKEVGGLAVLEVASGGDYKKREEKEFGYHLIIV